MRQFPRFPSKYLFDGEKAAVFARCKNARYSVDENNVSVYKMLISSQRKDTLIILQNAFSLRLKLP